MKIALRLMLFAMSFLIVQSSFAQSKTITGRVTSSDDGTALPGVSVVVKGTANGASTDGDGKYTIQAAPGSVLVYTFIGMLSQERTVGVDNTIDVVLKSDAKSIDEVVVTALGITQEKRALGYAVTEVKGSTVAQTQRENFLNGLQGRVAGVEVTSTSGLPGSSSSIMIRGVSSLSGSNQPLFIVDGLPIDNKTFSTSGLASDKSSGTAFNNRGVDFTNRAADINPEDIESITVLKGPEAAALYGIDAASGAIVITTKRGKAGEGQINYSNSFRVERIVKHPEIQQVYNRGDNGIYSDAQDVLRYNGPMYASETPFYNNIEDFFQTAFTQKHNLTFQGGTEKSTYRISSSYTGQEGFVPGTQLQKLNLGSAVTSKLNKYISTDITFDYTYQDNDQTYRGDGGPLIGLLLWPSNDDASNYLTTGGNRRRFSSGAAEFENPYFNVNKNKMGAVTNRYRTNVQLSVDPTDWFKFVGNAGFDFYTTEINLLRHAESNSAGSRGGVIDQATDKTRNVNLQYYAQFNRSFFGDKLHADLKLGSALNSFDYYTLGAYGEGFLDPNLSTVNNVDPTKQRVVSTVRQRRLVGAFGNLVLDYDGLLYLTLTGRNDWTSTLPIENRSFFYPSAALSFNFTELNALSGIKNVLSYGKLRASVAQVGKDANPYSIVPALETQVTTGGGFGYGFTAPSPFLKPEMKTSYEVGTEMKFFDNRVGFDLTYYNSKAVDQIVKDLRLSYGTGFILQVFNGGTIRNSGVEFQLNATPVLKNDFTWDVLANFTKQWSELVELPQNLSEFYVSDTWLYGNIRNGSRPGGSLTTLTGFDYLRNDKGQILINPATGFPMRNTTNWVVVADRQPDFNVGLTNTFSYKGLSLSFLLDIRKGGDIFNATEHFLTQRGLSKRTLNREQTIVYQGVLKDGKENTESPTVNNIVIDPYRNPDFWTSTGGVTEVDFIEKDINWVRLRDVTLNYNLPTSVLQRTKFAKNASVFVTGTDMFILTNYSGLDPVVNGNSAAVGGSGAAGIDFGNFPMPMGVNFGVRVGF
jgi:TonB-linked SusC/RagA family outer membrane protein